MTFPFPIDEPTPDPEKKKGNPLCNIAIDGYTTLRKMDLEDLINLRANYPLKEPSYVLRELRMLHENIALREKERLLLLKECPDKTPTIVNSDSDTDFYSTLTKEMTTQRDVLQDLEDAIELDGKLSAEEINEVREWEKKV